jgi:hypothetical protein
VTEAPKDTTQKESTEGRYMTHDDFSYAADRVDKIELTIAGIMCKIDKLFMFLELMEVEKIERRKTVVFNKNGRLTKKNFKKSKFFYSFFIGNE